VTTFPPESIVVYDVMGENVDAGLEEILAPVAALTTGVAD
jgi:hypothetical protein